MIEAAAAMDVEPRAPELRLLAQWHRRAPGDPTTPSMPLVELLVLCLAAPVQTRAPAAAKHVAGAFSGDPEPNYLHHSPRPTPSYP